jgi:delta8-fatty-acid desaturase
MDLSVAVPSFLLTHFVAGLLHVQILVSHTAMDYCCDGHGSTGVISDSNSNDQAGYYEWQALSTMDVDCPTYMDWFHGGLQFQLEHHLFPRVPRWRLRELSKLTDEIFARYDIPVVRMSFVEGNINMLKHLADIGEKVSKKHMQKKIV